MDYAKESLKMHYELRGKLEVTSRAAVDTKDALSLAYTPGVAAPCLEIQKDVNKSYELTRRWNTVAVVTDGTAVLGLGDIGPEAGMPVMEGKCVLFKEFGGVDAIPLCVRSKDVDDIVNTVRLLAGSFGGVNLEDISAPRCFEIEKKLKECCDIPIFHDDQHGTAVITLAGVINALKLVGKKLDEVKIVTSGAGAAGIAIIRLLISMGLKNVIMTDRKGAIYEGRDGLNPIKEEMAKITNYNHEKGTLAEVIKGADIFIGVSAPGTLHSRIWCVPWQKSRLSLHAQIRLRRSSRTRRKRQEQPLSAPEEAITRTRSTTYCASRASSAERSTCAHPISTMR